MHLLHPLRDEAALLLLHTYLVRALGGVFVLLADCSDAVLFCECILVLLLIRFNLHGPCEELLKTILCFLELLTLDHAPCSNLYLTALFLHDPLDCLGCLKEFPFFVFRFCFCQQIVCFMCHHGWKGTPISLEIYVNPIRG